MSFETVFIGVVVALLYTELTGVCPGGIIVPAFLATALDQPVRALLTLAVAGLAVLAFRLASRYFILFGRRRFAVMILLAAFWTQACWLALPGVFPGGTPARVLGLIIPGLLANNLERQKLIPTLAALVTVTVITYFLGGLLGLAER